MKILLLLRGIRPLSPNPITRQRPVRTEIGVGASPLHLALIGDLGHPTSITGSRNLFRLDG